MSPRATGRSPRRADSASREIARLRREVGALREALGLVHAVDDLPDCFDALVGSMSGERLAVPLRHVLEVVPRVLLSPLPGADAHVAGYMRWRGVHVPVVDMGRRCGRAPLPARLEDRIVIVRRGPDEIRGLLLSDVEGVARIEKSALHAVHPDAQGADWALGFLQQAERPLLIVSLQKLLEPFTELAPPPAEAGAQP